ncbi:hypothetical protein, partial [Frankia nepalensis]|uniref:hypothetical protein n=1 Tax=Frankia nepalensis TaxID=1836974 RepID=UPI001EE4B509
IGTATVRLRDSVAVTAVSAVSPERSGGGGGGPPPAALGGQRAGEPHPRGPADARPGGLRRVWPAHRQAGRAAA